MWEKIVLNLLSNALKFTLSGEIGVSLRRAGERVELAVRDTGEGIAENEISRVFERFHRIEGRAVERTRDPESAWRSCRSWQSCTEAM